MGRRDSDMTNDDDSGAIVLGGPVPDAHTVAGMTDLVTGHQSKLVKHGERLAELERKLEDAEKKIKTAEGQVAALWLALAAALDVSRVGVKRINQRTKQLEEVAKVVNVELGKRLPPDERRSFDDAVQAAQMLHADGLEPPDDEPPAA
jgi:hypothetical protein